MRRIRIFIRYDGMVGISGWGLRWNIGGWGIDGDGWIEVRDMDQISMEIGLECDILALTLSISRGILMGWRLEIGMRNNGRMGRWNGWIWDLVWNRVGYRIVKDSMGGWRCVG